MDKKTKKRPILICLIGIDGSGKTTLAHLLVESFRKEGLDFRYVYGGLQSHLLRPVKFITSRVFLRNYSPFTQYDQYSSRKRKLSKRHGLLAKLYAAICWLDFALQTFFKISIPLMLGHHLVVDRYAYDTAINLGHNTNTSGYLSLESLDNFLTFFPTPTLLYLIDIDEEVAFARKADTPAVTYLAERRDLYKQIIQRYPGKIIYGATSREEQMQQIHQDVLAIIGTTTLSF